MLLEEVTGGAGLLLFKLICVEIPREKTLEDLEEYKREKGLEGGGRV